MEIGTRINNIVKNKSNMFLVLVIITIIIYWATGEYGLFNDLIDFLCASIAIAIVFIAFTKSYKNYSIFNYIGFGFPMLFFLNIIHSALINYTPDRKSQYIASIFVNLASHYVEHIIIILSVIFIKIKPKLSYVFIIYSAVGAIILLAAKATLDFNGTSDEYYQLGENIWGVIIGLFVIGLILIYENTELIGKKETKYLYLFLSLTFAYEIIGKFQMNLMNGEPVASHIIKYIAYYVLFKGLNEYVLNQNYITMTRDLIKAEEMNINLYKTLMARITIIKDVKEILSKSEKKYIDLIETINDGIIIFNGNIATYANNSSVKITGKSIEEIIEISLEEVFSLLNVNLEEVKKEKIIQKTTEILIDGELKYIEVYIFEYNEGNTILFIKDLTEKNKIYKLEMEYQKYLNEEKLKDEFFSNISHELRTPINVIYSSLQLKDLHIKEGNYEAMRNGTRIIRQNCLRLNRTINNFIDTNKISEGYIKPKYDVYNIVELLEKTSQLSVKYLDKMQITLTFHGEEEIYVMCDGEFVQRVFLNLLSNSAKYGKVNGKIDINVYIKEKNVYISVISDGKVISEDIRPYLFDRFTRLNKSLNRDKEGSGLGLYLSKNLMLLQNGDLTVEDREDNRNEFLIKIPYDCKTTPAHCQSIDMEQLYDKIDTEFSDIYM